MERNDFQLMHDHASFEHPPTSLASCMSLLLCHVQSSTKTVLVWNACSFKSPGVEGEPTVVIYHSSPDPHAHANQSFRGEHMALNAECSNRTLSDWSGDVGRVGRCWEGREMLGGSGDVGRVGRCWEGQGDAGRVREMLGGSGRCWEGQERFQTFLGVAYGPMTSVIHAGGGLMGETPFHPPTWSARATRLSDVMTVGSDRSSPAKCEWVS